jgi:two-component system NtrC family sensor kinase
MAYPAENAASHHPPELAAERAVHYRRLFRRFVLLTILCSFLPLLLVGWGINIHYTRFARQRMMDNFRTEIDHHRRVIELFLEDLAAELQLVALTHTREQLVARGNLHTVFGLINRDQWSITDLGLIGEDGRHLAYVGPYDLMDKNYRETFWFKEVMAKGLYISDMFMGFRKEPHFVIAVLNSRTSPQWILRATIDTEAFRSLVENVQIGQTGVVYLVNREGIFQTSPRFFGEIMGTTPFPVGEEHDGTRVYESEGNGDAAKPLPRQVVGQAWLREPRWKLVVRQDFKEAFAQVNHANRAMLIFLHVSGLTILVVAVLVTRYMIAAIRKRDHEADRLNQQLHQTGKLAAIGQLAAGVAHEINNPLAIVLTERQILLDMASNGGTAEADFQEQFPQSMSQIHTQVLRCKRITQNLLRFSRRTQSVIEPVDLNAFLGEVVELMEREARAGGVKFFQEFPADLPTILSDPSQLQQVFLNLITNAIDAHEGKPYGSVRITTARHREKEADGVRILIADSGCGIPAQNLERIYEPFFTTKPEGKGTGLGLAICYSIIRHLGGTMEVASQVGAGTTFTLFLPATPPRELLMQLEGTTEALGACPAETLNT